jgi:hypothetical protein
MVISVTTTRHSAVIASSPTIISTHMSLIFFWFTEDMCVEIIVGLEAITAVVMKEYVGLRRWNKQTSIFRPGN